MKLLLVHIGIFLGIVSSFAQKNIEKEYKKIDWRFENTAFKGSLKKADKLIALQKNNVNIFYLTKTNLKAAKAAEAISEYKKMNQYLGIADSLLLIFSKDSVAKAQELYFEIAQVYFNSGNFTKSLTYNDLGRNISSQNTIYSKKLNFQYAQILSEQGYYNEVFPLVAQFKKDLKTDIDATKKIKGKKAKKDLYQFRKNYANNLNLEAQTSLKMGDYFKTDSSLKLNEPWIKNNLRKRDLAYRDYLFILAQLYDKKKDDKNALKTYEKVNKYTKYKPLEKTGTEALEKACLMNFKLNKKHESNKAIVKFDRAIRRDNGRNSLPYLRYKLIEVEQLYLTSKYNKSEKKLNQVYKTKKEIPNEHRLRSFLLQKKIDLSLRKSNYEVAGDSLTKLLAIQSSLLGSNSPAYHKYKMQWANYLLNYTNNLGIVKNVHEESFNMILSKQLSPQGQEHDAYLQQISSYYEQTEKYDLAVKYIQDASNYVKKFKGDDNLDYAKDLSLLASALIKSGDLPKAEESLKKSIDIYTNTTQSKDKANKIMAYLTMSKLYTSIGNYQEAEIALKKASRYSKSQSKEDKISMNSEEASQLYIKQARYNQAEEILSSSLKAKEKKLGMDSKELTPTLNLIAQLNILQGNYGLAEKTIKRSQNISVKLFGDSSLSYAESALLMESLYKELGDAPKAEQQAQLVYNIRKKQLGAKHLEVANALNRLAIIKLYNNSKSELPEKLIFEALEIIKFNTGENSVLYADQLKSLAYLYEGKGNLEKADATIDQAIGIWQKANLPRKHISFAEAAALKARIKYFQSKYKDAISLYKNALRSYADIFNKQHPTYVKLEAQMARAFYMDKNPKEALKWMIQATQNYLDFTNKYFPALSFNEKTKFWNQFKEDFEFFELLAVTTSKDKPESLGLVWNNLMATKGLLLSSSIKLKQKILNSKDENLISKYNDWISKKQMVINSLALSEEALKEANINPASLEKDIQNIEKDLSESSELFQDNTDNKVVTWLDLKKKLKPNDYALEIFRYRYFDKVFTDSVIYAGLILSKQSKKYPDLVTIPNGKSLENKYIRYYRNNIIYKANDDGVSYNLFWKAFKSKIPDGANIYYSPEGVYNQINLETLCDIDGSYVLDKNQTINLSNFKEYLSLKDSDTTFEIKSGRAVLFGNPDFYKQYVPGSPIRPLPGTKDEITTLNKLFQDKGWSVKVLTEQNASEDSIKLLQSPTVLHIATHGYFKAEKDKANEDTKSSTNSEIAENPLLRSGLVTKGGGDVLRSESSLKINSESGVITAFEAMDLNLDQTKIVVLSACETGRGEVQIGEGVFGLQRALLVAGADMMIMTLFKVDDQVTKQLMDKFYTKWLKTGSVRTSLYEAKKEIKDKYKQPIYWGAFVLLGLE